MMSFYGDFGYFPAASPYIYMYFFTQGLKKELHFNDCDLHVVKAQFLFYFSF